MDGRDGRGAREVVYVTEEGRRGKTEWSTKWTGKATVEKGQRQKAATNSIRFWCGACSDKTVFDKRKCTLFLFRCPHPQHTFSFCLSTCLHDGLNMVSVFHSHFRSFSFIFFRFCFVPPSHSLVSWRIFVINSCSFHGIFTSSLIRLLSLLFWMRENRRES